MKRFRPTLLLPLALAAGVPAAVAQDDAALKAELAEQLEGVEAGNISESPVEGVYQVTLGSSVAYITADGRYLLQGELYDLATTENLTERTRAERRVGLLAAVEPEEMIVFGPEDGNAEHTITIFTDIDCGYCRQFHRDIEQVNALGIEVRYLFYPRSGPDTESWAKADKVWCAADRNAALTRAKLGGQVPDEECARTPVAEHFDLGHDVGVRGTPAVFTESGEQIGGYLAPDRLAEALAELSE